MCPAETRVLPGAAAAEPAAGAPVVSVVIPCYNHARFLCEAIESALAQRGPTVEVVVVDDGSTDDSAAVAARYPGVVYVRQANQGLAAARNAGLRASRGAYLVFLDADDRLLPDALAAGLACFARHPDAAFVSGDHRRIGAGGAPIETPAVPVVEGDHYLALLQGNYIGMCAAVMYRREAIEGAGGFHTRLPACEDYDLYLRIARSLPVAQHGAVVAEYRWHEANMSHDLGLMTRAVLAVLRAQAPHVRADARRRAAYRRGLAVWRAYYGNELVRAIRRDLGDPATRRRAWRHVRVLLRHAPAYATGRLVRAARRRLARRARSGPAAGAPPVGGVDLGDLRRTTPVSRVFGFDRGLPVDRYYIERFLARHAADVRGRVLEAGDDTYTRRFGGGRVVRRDVLHVSPGNPRATLVGDLERGDRLPGDAFDCIVLTQVLHLVFDLRAAVATLHRMLRPGGVLLATVPGISQLEDGQWGGTWYWSLTDQAARRLLAERFPHRSVTVEAFGNVLAATAFLHGLAAEELPQEDLDRRDPLYQVLVAARAVKPEAGP